jgi:hypothetical protein
MPRARDNDDEEPDDGDDYDAETDYDPDDPDTYPEGVYVHSDERSVVPCPYCRAEMDEESEQCPTCGTFVSREDAPAQPRSAVFGVLLLLALGSVLFMAVGC